ncbi:uncharacterized protein METZ01_LOCUS405511, partial [marine metagenome]
MMIFRNRTNVAALITLSVLIVGISTIVVLHGKESTR